MELMIHPNLSLSLSLCLSLSVLPALAGDAELGPRITHIGLVSSSDLPITPEPELDNGRRVYSWPQGYGFSVVVEAAPGVNRRAVGVQAFAYDPDDPSVLPDLQVLVSYRMGSGNSEVCEIGDENVGIPQMPALAFDGSAAVAAAINDFGCRVNDGEGMPLARVQRADACTVTPSLDFDFVDPNSTAQYCAFIARPFEFAFGDTVLAARVRDETGAYGPRAEIVVRVTGFGPTATPQPTGTSTATRTPTPIAPTRTPTRTATPRPPCPGDCSGNRIVTVAELLTGINIALERASVTACPSSDTDHDGHVFVDELTRAVRALLNGC
jgi:hypothetical protein